MESLGNSVGREQVCRAEISEYDKDKMQENGRGVA
jgi:hypothetical protein